MYKNKKILAIIPARGGSKGIPLKNLTKIKNISLIGHVANLTNSISEIDKTIISSDNDLIINEAKKYGISAPFRRPKYLSGDRVGDIDVLINALKNLERIEKISYDVILMLQPTSPLRNSNIVKKCFMKLIDNNLDAVWTISNTDLKYHPLKQILLINDDLINYYDEKGVDIIARQQLKPIYHRNGAAYSLTRECLLNQKSLMGKKTGSVIVKEPMVSIDNLEDIAKVEKIF